MIARYPSRFVVATLLALALGAMAPQAEAVQTVWLDFNNVNWPTFAGKTASDFEDAVLAIVQADYADYSYLTFTKTQPGGNAYSQIEFGEVSSAYGSAHIVDWDNRITDHNNLVRSNNSPGSAIDVFVSGLDRSPMNSTFDGFVTAVGGTASHEFGHALGLRHFDTFGPLSNAAYPVPEADQHIMATGSTGLNDGSDRTDYDRFWSEHSKDKLEYLDPANKASRKRNELNPTPLSHASIATAEPLTISAADLLPGTNREVMVKVGTLLSGQTAGIAESDFYSFHAEVGNLVYANIFSERLSDPDDPTADHPNPIDSILRLYDPSGTLVYTNDNIGYNATSSGTPGVGDSPDAAAELLGISELLWAAGDVGETPSSLDGPWLDAPYTARSTDSILVGDPSGDFYRILTPGTWYLEVLSATSNDTGAYELFVSISRLPEPATCLLVAAGLAALIRRRRK